MVIWCDTNVFQGYLAKLKNYGKKPLFGVDYIRDYGIVPDFAVTAIAFDAERTDLIYAAVQGILFKSIDGGETWERDFDIPENGRVTKIVAVPKLTNTIYIGGGRNIYYSRDGGNTISKLIELERNNVLSLKFDDYSRSLFIGTRDGIYQVFIQCCDLINGVYS